MKSRINAYKGKQLTTPMFCDLAREILLDIDDQFMKSDFKIKQQTYVPTNKINELSMILQDKRNGHKIYLYMPSIYDGIDYDKSRFIRYNIIVSEKGEEVAYSDDNCWASLKDLKIRVSRLAKKYINKPKMFFTPKDKRYEQGQMTLYQIDEGKMITKRLTSKDYEKFQIKNKIAKSWKEMLYEINYYIDGNRPLEKGENTFYRWVMYKDYGTYFIYGKNLNQKVAQEIYNFEIKKCKEKFNNDKIICGNMTTYRNMFLQ